MATAQIRIEAQVQQALGGIDQVNRSLGGLQSTLGRTSTAMSSVQRTTDLAATAFRGLIAAISVREIINLADSATLVNNKLRAVLGTSEAASAAFQEVGRIAKESSQRFEDIGDLYQKVALQSKNLGLSQSEVSRIVENVAKGLTKYGASAQQAASFTYQFSQALGRGTLKYEDFRDMLEASPAMVANIARQFGMTTSEFLKAVQDGKLASEQLALAMNSMGKDVDLSGMSKTVGQSLNDIRTNFILLLDRFEKSTGAFSKIANLLKLLADNLDTVVVAGTAFFAVFAVKKITDIVSAFGTLNAVIRRNPLIAGATLAGTGVGWLYQKFFGDKKPDDLKKDLKDINDAGNPPRGVADARVKTEQELTKEQMAGLDAYFRKLEAQKAAAGLSGQELAVQKAISAAAQDLKVSEDQLTATVKSRVAERAIEIYNQEQSKKNAETIAKAETQRNQTLAQATLALDDQLQISKLSVQEQEIERQIKSLNRSLIREIRDESGKLLGHTQGLTAEEEKQHRLKLQQLQADREAVLIAQQKALLAGQALPQTREQQIQTATAAIGRMNPKLVAEQQLQTELAAIRANEYLSEQEKLAAIEQLHREHAGKLNQIYIQQEANQRSMKEQAIVAEQMRLGKTAEQAQTYANFEMKTTAEKTQFGIQQAASLFTALGAHNKKAFEAAKAFNIANAIMNTFLGATQALKMYPPPYSFIAAAAQVASGMAQVAQIRSQQYSGRQLGGPVMNNRSYLVGEAGPEIFTPTSNGSITRNSDIGGGTPVNVTFQINAIDTNDFDTLITQRQGVIKQIISDAMLERGQRSMV